ncbi:hypothetical protein LCGC14_2341310 [marine sediment metagenome]|uniref:Uncharacterized protein n=2 Tax=root TaxID=1 RepID=A0A0F9F723_9ZZZZ|nr:MAG: hypothetical protein LCMAC202_00480 [Marseillevirus LCMAC202]
MVNQDVILALADNLFIAEKVNCSWWNKKVTFKNCKLKQPAGPFPIDTVLERIVVMLEHNTWKAKLFVNKSDTCCVELGFRGVWAPLSHV